MYARSTCFCHDFVVFSSPVVYIYIYLFLWLLGLDGRSPISSPQLPVDSKKKKGGKGKGKGKGKKVEAAGGGAAGASGARLKLQEALSAFGWEVSELFRAMSAGLKVCGWWGVVFDGCWCCCDRCGGCVVLVRARHGCNHWTPPPKKN